MEVREGASAQYTVKLTGQPAIDLVTVTMNVSGEAYANPTSLNFTMANWDRPQTVTINARQNEDVAGADVQVQVSPHRHWPAGLRLQQCGVSSRP